MEDISWHYIFTAMEPEGGAEYIVALYIPPTQWN